MSLNGLLCPLPSGQRNGKPFSVPSSHLSHSVHRDSEAPPPLALRLSSAMLVAMLVALFLFSLAAVEAAPNFVMRTSSRSSAEHSTLRIHAPRQTRTPTSPSSRVQSTTTRGQPEHFQSRPHVTRPSPLLSRPHATRPTPRLLFETIVVFGGVDLSEDSVPVVQAALTAALGVPLLDLRVTLSPQHHDRSLASTTASVTLHVPPSIKTPIVFLRDLRMVGDQFPSLFIVFFKS